MSRSSPYSSILGQKGFNPGIPEFVFGADIGDLSGALSQREMNMMAPQMEAQRLESNRMILEEKQRQREYEQSVADMITSQEEMPKLRDLYGMMSDKAAQFGSVDDYLKLQGRISDLEQQEQKQQLSRFDGIEEAFKLGAIDPALAEAYLQASGSDYQFSPEARRRMTEKADGKQGKAKADKPIFITDKNGNQMTVPLSQFNEYAKDGWRKLSGGGASADPIAELMSRMAASGLAKAQQASDKQESIGSNTKREVVKKITAPDGRTIEIVK